MSNAPWRTRTKLIQGPPGPPGLVLGTATWTPGTVGSGASVSVSVTVVGALVGQLAMGSFSLALPSGVYCVAQAGAGVVIVTLVNQSGVSQTIGAGTVTGASLVGT